MQGFLNWYCFFRVSAFASHGFGSMRKIVETLEKIDIYVSTSSEVEHVVLIIHSYLSNTSSREYFTIITFHRMERERDTTRINNYFRVIKRLFLSK